MSATLEELTAVPAGSSSEQPAPAVSGRITVIAEIRKAADVYADNVIAARRLTTGYDRVRNGQLCSTGTQEFMARGKLHPPGERIDIAHEPDDVREKMEQLVRDDVWMIVGGPDVFDDYTVSGLRKRLEKIRKAHQEWQALFRKLIIQYTRENRITREKRDSSLKDLDLEPYVQERRISVSMNGSWIFPAANGISAAVQARNLMERIHKAVVAEFGTELGEPKTIERLFFAEGTDI